MRNLTKETQRHPIQTPEYFPSGGFTLAYPPEFFSFQNAAH